MWKPKLFLFLAALAALPVSLSAKARQEAKAEEVVVLTYDSFNSEWGPGPQAAAAFEAAYGVKVRWVTRGDAGSALASLLADKGEGVDVILGLDQNLAPAALQSGLLAAYTPPESEKLLPGLRENEALLPFDYSFFAIIYDSERIKEPPLSLEDLLKPDFKSSLILMDPRTSSPGLGFLSWTKAVYGEAWPAYWERLSPSILTICDGWDSGYGLFTAGEAPLVLSYTTSPGYHLEYEESERFLAAIFSEGHLMQIEYAAALKNAPNAENARRFLTFLLSDEFQTLLPLTNWMYPVTGAPLPASYRINVKPQKTLPVTLVTDSDLRQWTEVMRK